MDKQKLQRINVVGGSGSGKSTFCKKLAAALDASHVELDALHWLRDWQAAEEEVFFDHIRQALAGQKWILDGNYSRSLAIKWQHVQTVVWLDYSFTRTVLQALKRALARIFDRRELWPGTGNRESFKLTFLSKDSVLLWTISQYRRIRQQNLAYMQNPDFAHIQFVQVKNPKQARHFLASVAS